MPSAATLKLPGSTLPASWYPYPRGVILPDIFGTEQHVALRRADGGSATLVTVKQQTQSAVADPILRELSLSHLDRLPHLRGFHRLASFTTPLPHLCPRLRVQGVYEISMVSSVPELVHQLVPWSIFAPVLIVYTHAIDDYQRKSPRWCGHFAPRKRSGRKCVDVVCTMSLVQVVVIGDPRVERMLPFNYQLRAAEPAAARPRHLTLGLLPPGSNEKQHRNYQAAGELGHSLDKIVQPGMRRASSRRAKPEQAMLKWSPDAGEVPGDWIIPHASFPATISVALARGPSDHYLGRSPPCRPCRFDMPLLHFIHSQSSTAKLLTRALSWYPCIGGEEVGGGAPFV
ncbi:hypothetical protein VTK26DRAFT_7548 [Humicola hyalothermophila]